MEETLSADATAEPSPRAPRRKRAVWGLLATIVIAFATGALTYREANTLFARPTRPTVVAGRQAPAGWVGDFARAFCSGDAEYVSAHVAGELDIGPSRIAEAFATRAWQCASTRYLGTATNSEGQHHLFVMTGGNSQEQWFVFTVADDKVVAID